MEREAFRRKFDKKAYLQALHEIQKKFERKYRIELSESFDPRNWLKSRDVEAILIWPENPREEYETFLNGKCKTLDFWFDVHSNGKNEKYIFAIKYFPYQAYNSTIFFPHLYAHECPYTISWITSFGNLPLHCKHVYAALREVDKIAKNENIPISESFFYPRDDKIFHRFKEIERDRKLTPEEKLRKTFDLLEEGLYINELPKLEILNKRLRFLEKV